MRSYCRVGILILSVSVLASCNVLANRTTASSTPLPTATRSDQDLILSGTPSIFYGSTEQCMMIGSEYPPNNNFSGYLVVSEQDANRFNYFSVLSLDNQSAITLTDIGEPGRDAIVSPDHHWVAYEQWLSKDFSQHWLVIASSDSNTKLTIPWRNKWRNVAYWVDTTHLLIRADTSFSILDPFNNVEEEIELSFSNLYQYERHWEKYLNVAMSPDRSNLVYPTKGEGLNLITFPDRKIVSSVSYVYLGATPKWSPDGGYFIFAAPKSFDPDSSWVTIVLGTPSGKYQQIILPQNTLEVFNFSWSPDGKYVAFWMNYNYEEYHLTILDLEEHEVVDACVTSHSSWFFSAKENVPLWSPDGSKLAFAIQNIEIEDVTDLVVVDLREGVGIKIEGNYRPIGWLDK